ncbi:MAG: Gldg family protein [Anaerolineae bacterium]|nr:Gldg family protein [Anaerolineae bacterium]
MKQTLAITRKELRSYFGSPMALIFIGAFLIATLFAFFWIDAFFARGIADVRPLFMRMPALMIFLVAALTMRQWSEEARSGTQEILLTLPISTTQLVVGKFLAVVALVAIALVLTLPLPFTVTILGNLDWGPVFGGYLAALLLAASYAAIGLFVSSLTDNQIVSLIATVLLCGVFYIVGTSDVTDFVGSSIGVILHAIGAGSRFESILRGVIDLRDLLYYITLSGVFLALNILSLKSKGWSQGVRTRAHRTSVVLTSVLVVLNLVVANVWAYPLQGLRVDLTEQNEYTLSQTTRDLVGNLQETLLVRAYFSEKTHPLLAPLEPEITDLLQEYAIASGGKLELEVIDPTKDPDKEVEANQVYGIRPTPFQVADRYESSIVNSYFDILIRYGDQSTVLNFQDLIEIEPLRDGSIDVRLRNLEYDLTSAIKKTVYGFQNVETVLASLAEPAELTLYITPNTLPEELADAPETIEKIAAEIAAVSKGNFSYTVVDPTSSDSPISQQELYDIYGLTAIPLSFFSEESYYLYMVIESGDKAQVVYPSGGLSETEVRSAIESALKRSTSGFLTVVGVWSPPETPTQDMFGQTQQPLSTWQEVSAMLGQEYEVRTVDLSSGQVPADIDVLVVIAPQGFTDKEHYAIDQYLMRGGAVVMAAGNYGIDLDPYVGALQGREITDGVRELLANYGITVEQSLVLDPVNEPFPMPTVREVAGIQVQELMAIDYPMFVNVQPSTMASGNPIVSNLSSVTLNWVSPVIVDQEQNAGRTVDVLLSSSEGAWTTTDSNIQPDFDLYPEYGFPVGEDQKSYPLAVAIQGSFESAFKDKPSPFEESDESSDDTAAAASEAPATGTIANSPDTARLVVIGSGEFLDDVVFNLSATLTGERYMNSITLVQNAVAWSTEDLDLLNIRSRGTSARLLPIMDESMQRFWERVNYGLAVVALIVLGFIWNTWSKKEQPMELSEPQDGFKFNDTPAVEVEA